MLVLSPIPAAKRLRHCARLVVCWAAVASSLFAAEPSATGRLPKVFLADPQVLAAAKAKLAAGDNSLKPAIDRLLSDAARALSNKLGSVMDKERIPPSGDKHDYISQAPYFWRDTNSSDGRFVRRDGERNPEANRDSDAGRFGGVCSSAHTLALAYYFTGDEKYAARATEIVRVWFLNPATRMNPNLNFGQGIPGQVDGRAAGIIGSRGLVALVDALGLLADSKSWTAEDQKGMVAWMDAFLDWLTTSRIGIAEGNASNNHGTFYDTQVVALALFVGKTNLARDVIANAREKRIGKQIEPDGSQPRELGRTRSFSYSLFNIKAMLDLANLGRNVGIDLWQFETSDGRSLRKAIAFVAPYADPAVKWPYQQIHDSGRDSLGTILLRAAPEFPDAGFAEALKKLTPAQLASQRERLMFKTAGPGAGATTTVPDSRNSPNANQN